jgi:hypothetical protein
LLLAIAVVAYEAQSPGKDSGKPPVSAASGRAGTPKPSKLRTTSGAELSSRENSGSLKPRPTRAELPDDTRQIKELTPKQAKLLLAKIQSPGKDSGKPSANAASGGAGTPKPSKLLSTSGAELGSRGKSGNRKLRPTRAELPDNPSQIKELTPELAKRPLAELNGRNLRLNGLTTLDADTANALAQFKGAGLWFKCLTTLDADTALALAEFNGSNLELSGLTTLGADTAKALAEFKGSTLNLSGLATLDADTARMLADSKGYILLNGLTTLDADTAKALAEFKGSGLNLNGLTTLDADTAKTLAEFKGSKLYLNGLTTLDANTARTLAEFKVSNLFLKGLNTLDANTAKALAELVGKAE